MNKPILSPAFIARLTDAQYARFLQTYGSCLHEFEGMQYILIEQNPCRVFIHSGSIGTDHKYHDLVDPSAAAVPEPEPEPSTDFDASILNVGTTTFVERAFNTDAVNDALASNQVVNLPRGTIEFGKSIILDSYSVIRGAGMSGAPEPGGSAAGTLIRLIGTGTGFTSAAGSNLLHGGMENLNIQSDQCDWVFDLNSPIGWDFNRMRIYQGNPTGGLFRSRRVGITSATPSWMNHFSHVEMRSINTSTEYVLDTDMSDGTFHACLFGGARGSIVRGTGNLKIGSSLINNFSDVGLTISREIGHISSVQLHNSSIEEAQVGARYDVLIDMDADGDSIAQGTTGFSLMDNNFRSFNLQENGAGDKISVKILNDSGVAVRGGLINGNQWDVTTVVPLEISANHDLGGLVGNFSANNTYTFPTI